MEGVGRVVSGETDMGQDMTAVDNLFRSIVERSPMVNNDEHVVYTARAMTVGDARGRLVLSRPVYDLEVSAGLVTEDGDLFGRREPEATSLIDAHWRVKSAFDGYAAAGMFDGNLDRAVAHYIACSYYDCMSGGCPTHVLSILRHACEEFAIDGGAEVYPGADGWHTVTDFLNETAGVVDAKSIVDMRRLPAITCAK